MTEALDILRQNALPFASLMGVELVSASPDCVEAKLAVRKEHCTIPDILHGGAIMALADTLGGMATFLNLDASASTTTIESKTNFLSAVPLGDTALAQCTPVHRGRKLMVWQTRITRGDGKLAAIVTQTQMVL
ncbi:hotdog fold thioesterase [Parvibaculum sedimenti]|uniref:Hotdog fold thioesterase n=1 Tax=Parvibaculum sedimenti TaxID=2608632 RepID=A0A6N6VFU8_9HYPH|nr:PaaI family thioesterase [Parvibaculum sedimenti]KAB7738562.1 hotdog fold thioesterase [Parvibaculum sedimenti]